MNYRKIFNKKTILITGHTGFKGSWLTLWLQNLGGKIVGVSKNTLTSPSHFNSLKFSKSIISKSVDITNFLKFRKIINTTKPDFIFHLAAQALVKKSYINTLDTWQSNLMGTVNLLESLKNYKKKVNVILITSDKAYKNLEIDRGYKEDDLLGGVDPYGASKSSAELAIKSYIKSFFSSKNNKVSIAIARAGNVIGGGDWSENRLVPDCIRSWSKQKKAIIRSPNSTRPWQHVLEALNGYIILAINLKINKKKYHGQAFNFGPNNKHTFRVIEVVKEMKKYWSVVSWKIIKSKKIFFENTLLKLNSTKAKKNLNWKCILKFNETIFLTTDWYKKFYKDKKKAKKNSLDQINYYQKLVNERKN
jgi:CDP-glucose 4,6-dehydratase